MAEQMMQEAAGKAIPVGYKQTEVGVIPEDWEVLALSAICDVRDGTHDSPKYKDSGIPLVTSKNIVDDVLNLTNVSLISPDDAIEINKRSKVDKGDIIMSMIGTVGSAVLLIDEPEFCIKNVALFKPKRVIGEFLIQLINSKYFQGCLEDSMDGGIQKFVSLGTLRDMAILLPSRKEQTAIANVLSDSDALIGALEQLIAKKQAIKSATMQQLLTGRTRLPAFALRPDGTPKGYKPSELGEIPEDWGVVCFDQLKDKKDNWAITGGPFGSNLKASDYTENGVRVIQLQNIGDGVFKNDDFVYTSYKKANELISCNIYPDEIILSKMGDPVARACLIPHFHSRYVMCSDGIRLKVDNQRYSEKFVFYFLNYQLFRNQALDASTGSTRKRIGLSELRELLLFAPTKEEQTAIATMLSDMDSELQVLTQKLEKTRALKQGMMQQLLTGKIRLPLEMQE